MNPNKMHVILYLALAAYILLSEGIFFTDAKKNPKRMGSLCNKACDIPFDICSDDILFSKTFIWRCDAENDSFYPLLIPAGVIGWLVYDVAYRVFKRIFYERFHTII